MNGSSITENTVYYVLRRGGGMFGPFTEEELHAGLNNGQLELTDFVQIEGRVHWQPLGRLLGAPAEAMRGALAPDWNCLLKWAWRRLRYHFDEQVGSMAVACLGAGLLFLVLSRWPFVFWVPCFLLAAMAAVILFLRERKVAAAFVLVGVIAVPWLFLHFSAPPSVAKVPEVLPTTTTAGVDNSTPVIPGVTPPAAGPAASPALLDKASNLAGTVASLFKSEKKPDASVPESPEASLPMASPATLPAVVPTEPPAVSQPQPALSQSAAPQVPSLPPVPGLPSATPGSGAKDDGADLLRFVPQNDALVIIKGSNGSGSGFLCRVGDKTWLYSNIHVVSEVKQPKLTRLDGVAIPPGAAELAVGRDLARMALAPPPPHALEATTDFDNEVHIDDDVVVLGNKGGGGVVTALKGKVVGIGPDRLEVSAEFIPGNSGSPIVHLKTGKVIGIATYLTKRYEEFSSNPQGSAAPAAGTNGNAGAMVVRRYGYRIDKVPSWEPVNWAEMYAEADQVEQVSKLTEDIFDFLSALRNKKEPTFATDTLRRQATDWMNKVRGGRLSDSDRRNATQGFLNALRLMVRADVASLDGRLRYTFFRNRLSDEQKVRDQLYQAFSSEFADISSPESRHSFSHKH